jgi:hypothetical protein
MEILSYHFVEGFTSVLMGASESFKVALNAIESVKGLLVSVAETLPAERNKETRIKNFLFITT